MNRFALRQSLILFLIACIWGLGFIAQSVGMDYVEPFTFTAARNMLAFLVLVPIFGIFLHKKAGAKIWIAVALALFGMYLLCITKGGFRLQLGDS